MFPEFTLPHSLMDYVFGAGGREGIDAFSGENQGFRPMARPFDEQTAKGYIESFLKNETADTETLQAALANLKSQLSDAEPMRAVMDRHRRSFYEFKHDRSCSALELAVISRDARAVERILAGPDMGGDGNDFGPALAIAVEIESLPIVSLLARYGAGINAQDADGRTALHTAAGLGLSKMVESLLSAPDCDARIPDATGATPLMEAAELGEAECVELLIPRSDLLARNANGASAADLALADSPEIARTIGAAFAARESSDLNRSARQTLGGKRTGPTTL